MRADYDGVPQGTQVAAINGDEESVNADIMLYERTTDNSSVAITWAQVLVNYAPIREFGLEVRLDLELVNNGDRIVTTDTVSTLGWPISVAIELPAAAFGIQPMQSENSQRYQVDTVNSVPVLQDNWPLRPQQVHTITVLYYLPYTNGAVIDQAFGFPVMDASILLPNDTVSFESDQFDGVGEFRYRVADNRLRVEELNPDEKISDDDPQLIKAHDLFKPLAAEDRMIFTLSGRPTRTIDVLNPNTAASDPAPTRCPISWRASAQRCCWWQGRCGGGSAARAWRSRLRQPGSPPCQGRQSSLARSDCRAG